ncbi:MAG TPA: hypothetical protein VHQ65_02165 [Thermoanaerobaculia bacterium]|nr:hypothetical protein [Thermoanaerobaculia bacterium]
MGKNDDDGAGERRVTGRPTGGGAYPHLWVVRAPILQWISRADLPFVDQWLGFAAGQAGEGAVPAPSLDAAGAALAADLAWLGDFLAWLGAYRENADLRRDSDRRVGLVAEAAAGWLVVPVAALAERFGPVPPTWNEEEALRRQSRLFLPERFWAGLEWMVSLAYVTGAYYETPDIDPELHLPTLLEVGKTEAQVLLANAGSLAAEPAVADEEIALLARVAAVLSKISALHPFRVPEAGDRWARRPAVPSRRS